MSAITINDTQRVFVIREGGGFSCLGFNVVFERLKQYAGMLNLNMPKQAEIGQLAQYEQYLKAESAYIASKPTSILYDPGTAQGVKDVLERYRGRSRYLRVFYGNGETGRDWMEENDVVGRIGASWGPIKVALLVPKGEDGGGAMLTACVVRIIDTHSKTELYRHPTYTLPTMTSQQGKDAKRPFEVWVDGACHARFATEDQRRYWLEFMQGKRMSA